MDDDDNFNLALRKNFAKLNLDSDKTSVSQKSKPNRPKPGAGSTAQRTKSELLDDFPRDSPLRAGLLQATEVLGKAREEVKNTKARKKDRKAICGRCDKLQTCSRCSCSAQCQKEHWKGGHKAECSSFTYPPLAKCFDNADRPDVPWPIDPIFAQGNDQGLGIWVTTCGSNSGHLGQAFEPADGGHAGRDPMGPPSFQSWAGVGRGRVPTAQTRKYVGSTLFSLRVAIQNRRKDDRVIMVYAGMTRVTVADFLEDFLLPEDKKKVIRKESEDGIKTITVPPWVDYNGQTRSALLEINGFEAPLGKFGDDKEYHKPPRPTGGPWNRVIDWGNGLIVLAPGDYAVVRVQFRLGDGKEVNSYPQIMSLFGNAITMANVLQCKSTTSKIESWLAEAHLSTLHPGDTATVIAGGNYDYIDEYYRPWLDQSSDVWAEQRLGGRAKVVNDMHKTMVPAVLEMTLNSLPPDKKQEALRRFQTMGFDVENMLKEAKKGNLL
ncbi:hypothetical protein DL96DRAFT_1571512 [Flagelloscypha sp. PMI_526]|nr:hypothetical protein DL96DRAFT_1571512 [Flagelloscypha sp. PMI_526]